MSNGLRQHVTDQHMEVRHESGLYVFMVATGHAHTAFLETVVEVAATRAHTKVSRGLRRTSNGLRRVTDFVKRVTDFVKSCTHVDHRPLPYRWSARRGSTVIDSTNEESTILAILHLSSVGIDDDAVRNGC